MGRNPKSRDNSIDYVDIVAENLFTDRTSLREAFWNMYDALEDGQYDVINFHGVGGIGKTSLLRQLGKELEERDGCSKRDYLYYSFESVSTKEEFLFTISRMLMLRIKGFSCPLFDTAFAKVLADANKGISAYENQMAENLAKGSFADFVKDTLKEVGNNAFDSAFNAVFDDMLGVTADIIPGSSIAMKVIKRVCKIAADVVSEHEKTHGPNASDYRYIQNNAGKNIREKLHEYLAVDLQRSLAKRSCPFVFFIDGYEKFVDVRVTGKITSDEEADIWLKDIENGFVYLPNVIWAIAGREALHWPEDALLPECILPVGDLSENDTEDFLRKAGVTDESLIFDLYKLTKGTPDFLRLCVDTYRDKIRSGKVTIEDFEKDQKKLALKNLEGMSEDMRNLIKILSGLPNVWTREMAEEVARKVNYGAYLPAMDKVLSYSLIERLPKGYRLHPTIRDAIRDLCGDEIEIYDEEDESTSEIKGTVILAAQAAFDIAKNRLFSLKETDYRMDTIYEVTEYLSAEDSTVSMSDDDLRKILDIIKYETKQSGDYKTCAELIDRIIAYEDNHEISAEVRAFARNIGTFNYYRLGEYKKFQEYTKRAYEFAKEKLGAEHPETLTALRNMATSYYALGDYKKDLELMLECYETYVRVQGAEDPDTLRSLNALANCYYSLGEFEKARKLNKECYDARVRVLGKEHPNTLGSMDRLASSYYALGEYEKALQLNKECYGTYLRVLGAKHPDTLRSRNSLGESYLALGEKERALETFEECYDVRVKVLGAEHPETLASLYNLASSYSALGDYENALKMYKECYDARVRVLGVDHPDTKATIELLNAIQE